MKKVVCFTLYALLVGAHALQGMENVEPVEQPKASKHDQFVSKVNGYIEGNDLFIALDLIDERYKDLDSCIASASNNPDEQNKLILQRNGLQQLDDTIVQKFMTEIESFNDAASNQNLERTKDIKIFLLKRYKDVDDLSVNKWDGWSKRKNKNKETYLKYKTKYKELEKKCTPVVAVNPQTPAANPQKPSWTDIFSKIETKIAASIVAFVGLASAVWYYNQPDEQASDDENDKDEA